MIVEVQTPTKSRARPPLRWLFGGHSAAARAPYLIAPDGIVDRPGHPSHGRHFKTGRPPRPPMAAARLAGFMAGVRHAGCPWAACKAEAIAVRFASDAELLRLAGPPTRGRRTLGAADKRARIVYLNASLPPGQTTLVLAHELGHVLNPSFSEDECSSWASGFLFLNSSPKN